MHLENSTDDCDAGVVEPGHGTARTDRRRLLLPLALIAAIVASAGLAAAVFLTLYRPDRQTNPAVAAQVVRAASDSAVAVLSYAPGTADKDFAAAKTRLTGDFLNYYAQFSHDILTPAVKDKQVQTSATVVQSALQELHPASAEVLLFVNQTTVSKEHPDGTLTASSVKVGLAKVGNDWLVASFEPL